MASIRKRNGLWQAQVRSRKLGSTSKSFHKRTDAIAWAKVQEALMQTGEWKPRGRQYSTLDDLVQNYLKKVTPHKKGAETETRRLNRLLKEKSLMAIKLDEAKPHHFASFRDKRIKDGNRAAQYDLVLLRAAWNTARIWRPCSAKSLAAARFSLVKRPCLILASVSRARPSLVLGPVEAPPWSLQRPTGSLAGRWHKVPRRVRASHRIPCQFGP